MKSKSTTRSKLLVWLLVVLLAIETAFFIRALYMIDSNATQYLRQQDDIALLQKQVHYLAVVIDDQQTQIDGKATTKPTKPF